MAFDRKAYARKYSRRPEQRVKQQAACRRYQARIKADPEHRKNWAKKARDYRATERGKKLNRNRGLRFNYGITVEDYDRMSAEQDHACAICGAEAWMEQYGVLHVDHDHETGAIRGLLCSKCNTGLGLFSDASNRLRAAAKYLERF